MRWRSRKLWTIWRVTDKIRHTTEAVTGFIIIVGMDSGRASPYRTKVVQSKLRMAHSLPRQQVVLGPARAQVGGHAQAGYLAPWNAGMNGCGVGAGPKVVAGRVPNAFGDLFWNHRPTADSVSRVAKFPPDRLSALPRGAPVHRRRAAIHR